MYFTYGFVLVMKGAFPYEPPPGWERKLVKGRKVNMDHIHKPDEPGIRPESVIRGVWPLYYDKCGTQRYHQMQNWWCRHNRQNVGGLPHSHQKAGDPRRSSWYVRISMLKDACEQAHEADSPVWLVFLVLLSPQTGTVQSKYPRGARAGNILHTVTQRDSGAKLGFLGKPGFRGLGMLPLDYGVSMPYQKSCMQWLKLCAGH